MKRRTKLRRLLPPTSANYSQETERSLVLEVKAMRWALKAHTIISQPSSILILMIKARHFFLTICLVVFGAALGFGADGNALKIIKFEADWCGPCKAMRPAYQAVSESEKGVDFQTVDIDRQPKLANQYKVEAVPTIVAVKNGQEVGRLVGLQNKAQLRKFVKKHH